MITIYGLVQKMSGEVSTSHPLPYKYVSGVRKTIKCHGGPRDTIIVLAYSANDVNTQSRCVYNNNISNSVSYVFMRITLMYILYKHCM